MTAEGKAQIIQELGRLKNVERPRIVREIEEARGHGDLSENAEYHAAKDRQGHIEGQIRALEDRLGRSEVVDLSRVDGSRVVFGVWVKVFDHSAEKESTYRIVGEFEADLAQGLISVQSPLAKALIGKEAGDQVTVQAPSGPKELEVLEIRVTP